MSSSSSLLSNLYTVSSMHYHSRKKKNGKPLEIHRLLPSPLRTPAGLAIKAMAAATATANAGNKENLDHHQRTSNLKKQALQQRPKRRYSQSAPLGLWDRFPTAKTVRQMVETMERIMEDPFAYSGPIFPSEGGEEAGESYRRGRTPWEIKEGEREYKVRFDMPGMTKNDARVWVEENTLIIKAEKLTIGVKEEEQEWPPKSCGKYSSRISLPENVEVEKIRAGVKDGVLYITIPKISPESEVM